MLLRKITFLKRRICKHEIKMNTIQFVVFSDVLKSVTAVASLLNSDLIPPTLSCKIQPSLYETNFRSAGWNRKVLDFFPLCLSRLQAELSQFKRSLWATDYPLFLKQLIDDAMAHELPDEMYFFPLEAEVSFSRCLFCANSPHQLKLDQLLDRVAASSKNRFGEVLLRDIRPLVPEGDSRSRAFGLLLFFRCLANRFYERHPDIFAPRGCHLATKLETLSHLPARVFRIRADLLGPSSGGISIGDVFRNNQYFLSAALFLQNAFFQPNAIDAVFECHKALLAVRKAALINRMGASPATIEDMNALLAFDDLFGLLFGTVLATGPPIIDVEYLAWLVTDYGPRQNLAADLEYARANIEGIALHCRNLDIGDLSEIGEDDEVGPTP
jgi:hypothetical protein